MARPPKGKPLTLRPIRLDDDVWAECQRLGKEHGTINEGLRVRLFAGNTIHVELPPHQESDNAGGSRLRSKNGRRLLMAKKIITAQDMSELASRGFSAWQRLAGAAGRTLAETRRLVEQGALDQNAEAVAAFRSMMSEAGLGVQRPTTKAEG